MQYSDKLSRAAYDITELLKKGTSIEKIRFKMLFSYGLSARSSDKILEIIEKGIK